MARNRDGLVRVVCGPNDHEGHFAGLRVGEVKISLRDSLSIPYFSEPFLNGRRVALSRHLHGGDDLEFVKVVGVKGAEDRPRAEAEAEALVKLFGEELRRTIKEAIESAEARIMAWAEVKFGPPISETSASLKRLTELLAPAQEGLPGRGVSTADIAAFANARRPTPWKEICLAWKSTHPDDPRAATLTGEKVREAWRRYFGDTAKKKRF